MAIQTYSLFPVYADWDIDDLKTAIINKAHLGHLKTSDIILRRVRDSLLTSIKFSFSPGFKAIRSR